MTCPEIGLHKKFIALNNKFLENKSHRSHSPPTPEGVTTRNRYATKCFFTTQQFRSTAE